MKNVRIKHFFSFPRKLLPSILMKMMDIQPGDVEKTWADVSSLKRDYDYNPGTPVEVGIDNFVKWYREYYKV